MGATNRRRDRRITEGSSDADQYDPTETDSRPMTARQRCNTESVAGFTLLEALVATVLMGLILAALATITAQWLPNWNRGLLGVQRSEQIALGLDRLSADLAAAQFIPINGKVHEPFFDGTSRSVTFVRTAIGPNSSPGLDFVRIAEVDSDDGQVLVRTRALFVLSDHVPTTFAEPVVLLRAPYELSFSYAGADRVWRKQWQGKIRLPQYVRMTVRERATKMTLPISTTTVVHAEAPVMCVSAKSYADCLRSENLPAADK
jgi:general secretion pathway protein J